MRSSIGAGACAVLVLLALAASRPVQAAEQPEAIAHPPQSATTPKAGDDPTADDFALRYYASLGRTERVEKELSRLRRLYPRFEPPADLDSTPVEAGADEEALWDLFAADRLGELREAIAARERDTPGWRPSADLARKLRRKEQRDEVMSYWRDGRWRELVSYAGEGRLHPLDADVDVLWAIADACARAKQRTEAFAIYKSILSTARDRQTRIATMQKAIGSLRLAQVEALLAMDAEGRNGDDSRAIAVDVARARIAAFLHDERAEDVAKADLAQFEAFAREGRDPAQLGLVAWYYYKLRDFDGALEWFKPAIQNGGDATIAHGLAQTLRALDMRREAEDVAFAWREPLINNTILYLDLLERDLAREAPPYIEPERLARYAKVTWETASGEGAQALAWYAYNSCQFDVALSWFEKAVAWFPKETTVLGYALALKKTRNEKAMLELVNRYDGLFPRVVEVLFPDGSRRLAWPCDRRDAAKLHGAAMKTASYIVPGPAAPELAQTYDRDGLYLGADALTSKGEVAMPLGREQLAKRLRGKFPIAVAPDNPLRFGAAATLASARRGVAPVAAASAPLRPEPARGASPLVARRVPGVGPMPYERYGFALLPGWNGIETAAWPPASAQIAPAGTQWAESDAARAAAPRHGVGARLDPIYRLQPPAVRPPAAYPSPRAGGSTMVRPRRPSAGPGPAGPRAEDAARRNARVDMAPTGALPAPARAGDENSRAMLALPSDARVRGASSERRYVNGWRQSVALDAAKIADGWNELTIDLRAGAGQAGGIAMSKPTQDGIRQELLARFPTTEMRVVTRPMQNALGPFGLAIGAGAGGLRCAFAWQWVDDLRAAGNREGAALSLFRRGAPQASIRLRVCRSGVTADQLASWFERLEVADVATIDRMLEEVRRGGSAPGGPIGEPLQPITLESAMSGDARARMRTAQRPAAPRRPKAAPQLDQGAAQSLSGDGGPRYLAPLASTPGYAERPASAVGRIDPALPAQAYAGPSVPAR